MTKAKQKPVPIADRVYNSDQRKRDAGMRQIKVWVAGNDADPDGDEAYKVRAYASKQPVTKAIRAALEL